MFLLFSEKVILILFVVRNTQSLTLLGFNQRQRKIKNLSHKENVDLINSKNTNNSILVSHFQR